MLESLCFSPANLPPEERVSLHLNVVLRVQARVHAEARIRTQSRKPTHIHQITLTRYLSTRA